MVTAFLDCCIKPQVGHKQVSLIGSLETAPHKQRNKRDDKRDVTNRRAPDTYQMRIVLQTAGKQIAHSSNKCTVHIILYSKQIIQ